MYSSRRIFLVIFLLAFLLVAAVIVGRLVGFYALSQARSTLSREEATPASLSIARQYLDWATYLVPFEADRYFLEAVFAHRREDREGRHRALEQYANLVPDGWGAYYRDWLRITGEPELARSPEKLEPAFRFRDENALYRFWLSFPGMDPKTQEELLSNASALEGRSFLYHSARGLHRLFSGDVKGAREELEQARDLHGKQETADPLHMVVGAGAFMLAEGGESYGVRTGDWSLELWSQKQFERRVAALSLHMLGVLHRTRGEYSRAISSADAVLRKFGPELRTLGLEDEVKREIYPVNMKDIVLDCARRHGVDPRLVMAVIWQESKFDPSNVSHVGAIGLMQLMPETAKWVAAQKGTKDLDLRTLYDPGVNLDYGTWYLKHLLKAVANQAPGIEWVLAAYNGGIGNVGKWIKQAQEAKTSPLDTIPFQETRNFVEKVTHSYKMYGTLYPELAGVTEGVSVTGAIPGAKAGGVGILANPSSGGAPVASGSSWPTFESPAPSVAPSPDGR